MIKSITQDDSIKFNKSKFTYNKLKQNLDILNENMMKFNIKQIELKESDNIVYVYLDALNSITETDIKKLVDPSTIQFKILDVSIMNCTTDIINGHSITTKSGSTISTSTLGFCVKDSSGKEGFVMAGHGTTGVGQNVYYDGKLVGTVRAKKFAGNIDAAFVEKASSFWAWDPWWKVTPKLTNGETIYTWASHQYVPEGTQIRKFGQTTGITSGTITSLNFSTTISGVVFNDLVRTSCPVQPGDSGGPVIRKGSLSNNNFLAGILNAAAFDTNGNCVYSMYIKIENILPNLWTSTLYPVLS